MNRSYSTNTRWKSLVFVLVALSCQHTSSVVTTHKPASNGDHLLNVLQAIHTSHYFSNLPSSEQILLVELIAAAEVNQITHLIDRIGFARIATLLDHVSRLDQREAHALEHYLAKELNQEVVQHRALNSQISRDTQNRTLQSSLQEIMAGHLYQHLSNDDQIVLLELVLAVRKFAVTEYVHRVGYGRIISLVEHISTPADTHNFLTYLVKGKIPVNIFLKEIFHNKKRIWKKRPPVMVQLLVNVQPFIESTMKPWAEATLVTLLTAIIVTTGLCCLLCRYVSKTSSDSSGSQSEESKNETCLTEMKN